MAQSQTIWGVIRIYHHHAWDSKNDGLYESSEGSQLPCSLISSGCGPKNKIHYHYLREWLETTMSMPFDVKKCFEPIP